MRSQPSVDCCSLEQLSNLLDGQLGQFDSDLALAHIERCEVCRKSLEDLSGDASDWKAGLARSFHQAMSWTPIQSTIGTSLSRNAC